ncbi:MAG TPA: glucose-1-phosphate thymidylyltransferase RfbA [Chitinivibrionales bacterium]|nr:glucose-1-phosphate thymidylyltransferase RfbA [Chitinivibrionales bacterium]
MKGIILAGGLGTRLYPATIGICKQLLPVYDKPMVYYPLAILMLAKIRDILVITTPQDLDAFRRLLGSGAQWGLNFAYAVQQKPEGIAQAFILGKEFIKNDGVALILGDNIFWGHGLVSTLAEAAVKKDRATIFGYWVNDPQRYGVVELDNAGRPVNLVEKPKAPKSPYAVTGLYFYDNAVVRYAEGLKPSARGELEITDLNRLYLQEGRLDVVLLGRGVAWLDTGTHESMLQASVFVETIQSRQGLKVSCPEEIAFMLGYITGDQLMKLAEPMKKNGYGEYLVQIASGKR